jgi:hypothetical protein
MDNVQKHIIIVRYPSYIVTVLTFKRESINTKPRSEQMKAQCVTEGSLRCAGSLNSWHSAITTIMNLSPRGRHTNLVF